MIIYKCVISGDEMFSDIYKIKEDGGFYEVEGKVVTRTQGSIDDSLIGGNASAEEICDTACESSVSGVDIVLNHHLQETGFSKDSYKSCIKDYLKAVKEHLEKHHPEKVAAFMENSKIGVKKILGNFKNYQFFIGEQMKDNGMVGLLDYREDGITPYMIFWKDGLELEKC